MLYLWNLLNHASYGYKTNYSSYLKRPALDQRQNTGEYTGVILRMSLSYFRI
jgi:hypothetical protein